MSTPLELALADAREITGIISPGVGKLDSFVGRAYRVATALIEAAKDTERLKFIESYGSVNTFVMTVGGQAVYHIEASCGSTMQGRGNTLAEAIDAAKEKGITK